MPYGPPKAGKSFILLSLALHIAAGKDWFGMAVKAGAVVYIAGEGVGGLKLRSKAMRQAYEIGSDIPFWIVRRAINFRVKGDVDALVALIRDTIQMSPFAGTSVVLVIIDTLARAMPGADENSAQDVGLVIAEADSVKEQLGCAVALVHHEGKDGERGARGTSALRGAWDAAFRITRPGGKSVRMEIVDQKDAEAGAILRFEMREVTIAQSIGRSSLVPWLETPSPDTPEEHEPAPPPRGKAGLALDILTKLMAGPDSGQLPPHPGRPRVRGIELRFWRQAFYQQQAALDIEAKKKSFRRSVDLLTEQGWVGMDDPWVWLAKGDQ